MFDRVVTAANARDAETYASLLCDKVRQLYAREANPPLSGFPPTEVITVEEPVAQGPTSAELYATTRWADGSPQRSRYVFEREHGQWTYCPEAVWTRRS